MNPAEKFEELPGERKIVYISAILGIVLFVAYMIQRSKAGAAVSPSQGAGTAGTGTDSTSTPYDPNAGIAASKEVSLAAIAHSAALKFSIASNSLSHDLGLHTTSGNGGGSFSFGPIHIGGGGSKSGQDQWDLTTSNDYSAGFEGSGLSQDEFEMLLQQESALVNSSQAQQAANNAAASDKENRYKPQPDPTKAPTGYHLEIGADGKSYWVKNGTSIGTDGGVNQHGAHV